jgi:hypothetical protein
VAALLQQGPELHGEHGRFSQGFEAVAVQTPLTGVPQRLLERLDRRFGQKALQERVFVHRPSDASDADGRARLLLRRPGVTVHAGAGAAGPGLRLRRVRRWDLRTVEDLTPEGHEGGRATGNAVSTCERTGTY